MKPVRRTTNDRDQLRQALQAGHPLLLGRLHVSADAGEPILLVRVWCPFCKEPHSHGWDPPVFRPDVLTHRAPHCRQPTPFVPAGYCIRLDPDAADHNRQAIRAYHSRRSAGRQRPRTIPSLADLIELEPRLGELLAEVRSLRDDGSAPFFCANAAWYGYGGWRGIKPRLLPLVGDERQPRHPLLSTSLAYDVAYDALFEPLPPCRECVCL